MARKKQQVSRMSALFSTSEERVVRAREGFEAARTTLSNARAFGSQPTAKAAEKSLEEAAANYAAALRTHAKVVVDYATEHVQ